MCDAAVALGGGPGTHSEVTSALALGRPVAFVGPGWEDYDPTDADGLAKRTIQKFGGSLGTLVDEQCLRNKLRSLPASPYFQLGAESEAIAWIMCGVTEPFEGRFPEIVTAIEDHRCAKAEYEKWLAKYAS